MTTPQEYDLSPHMVEALHTVRLQADTLKCDDVALRHINKRTARSLSKRGLLKIFLARGGFEFCRLTPAGRAVLESAAHV